MRFNVPQFIEHEAKIIGPLTFRQFIYIGSAGVIAFILFYSVPGPFFFPIFILLALVSFALAFVKINGKPLPNMIVSFFNFLLSSRVYFWQKKEAETLKRAKLEVFEKKLNSSLKENLTRESQLQRLSTKIDTK